MDQTFISNEARHQRGEHNEHAFAFYLGCAAVLATLVLVFAPMVQAAWTSLYETWNLAFVTGNLTNLNLNPFFYNGFELAEEH